VQRGDLVLDLGHGADHLDILLPASEDLAAGQVERRVLGVVAGNRRASGTPLAALDCALRHARAGFDRAQAD
jgi:hypothetical protein